MNPRPRILIATNNNNKIKEVRAILQGVEIELISPRDIGLHLDIKEDGQTYAENAIKKAFAFSRSSGLPALADDTGLEVEALGGKPGLHSNRFGPKPYTDEGRRAFLLQRLYEKPQPWLAKFRATVAVVDPGSGTELVEGVCPGEIIPYERGDEGFGYDPIFQLKSIGRTMAELNMDEKNRLSHRGQAVRKVIPVLVKLANI